MAAPWQDLLEKTEAALKSVVDGLSLSGVASLKGSDDSTKTTPNVICTVDGSDGEDPLDSGIYRVQARVSVNSQASEGTGLTIHRTRTATVFDAMTDDGIAATLSAAVSDYYVYDVNVAGFEKDFDDQQFQNALRLDIMCCASDIG